MSFVRPLHVRKAILTIFDKWQEYNRIALQVAWGIVVCIVLVGLTGCSDSRATVQDIQSEFESLGFYFEVWNARDVIPGFGGVTIIGTDGVNVGIASRLHIELDVSGDSPIEEADWDSVSLLFNHIAPWRNPPDYAKRQIEYIIALISLLIPDMKNEVRQWIANSGTDVRTHTRRFGKMTVEVNVESSYEWGITFRPDMD